MGRKYAFAIETKNATGGTAGVTTGSTQSVRWTNDTGVSVRVLISTGGAELIATVAGIGVAGTLIPRESNTVGNNALANLSSVGIKMWNGTDAIIPDWVRLTDVTGKGGADGIEPLSIVVAPKSFLAVDFRNRCGQTVNAWISCVAERVGVD